MEILLRIHPPPTTIPAIPTSQHLSVTSIDINDDASRSLSPDFVASVSKRRRDIGKVLLLTMGCSKKDGPNLLSMRDSMTDIFELTAKAMAEALGNVLMSQSWEQADSLDYSNRQKSVPDWQATT